MIFVRVFSVRMRIIKSHQKNIFDLQIEKKDL